MWSLLKDQRLLIEWVQRFPCNIGLHFCDTRAALQQVNLHIRSFSGEKAEERVTALTGSEVRV